MIAVFDAETTGLLLPSSAPLALQPRIIELAVVLVEKGKVKSEHSWLIDPGIPLPAEITKITGLTDKDLKGKKRFANLLKTIKRPFLKADIVIGHNVMFDKTMVDNEVQLCSPYDTFPWPKQILCTVSLYDHLQGWRHSQVALYERIIGKPCVQTHRALDDVRQLVEILQTDKVFQTLEGK